MRKNLRIPRARRALAAAALWLATLVSGEAVAVPLVVGGQLLEPGVYALHNHPDGAEAIPFYGLRLDGLSGDDRDVVTFDFDHPSSDMRLHFTGEDGPLTISGVAWGGIDGGEDFREPQLFEILFSYSAVSIEARLLEAGPDTGAGWIRPLETAFGGRDAGEPIALVDENGEHDYSFRIGADHRGFAGLSGWGWLNHEVGGLDRHVYDSDWLFTLGARQVPEPGALALLTLAGLAVRRRIR